VFFNHIRFGVYFKDLVLAAAQENDLHPLLLLSVIRQESMFEGYARSSAGARGLMQLMPATGAEVAARMGWPENYADSDLYLPAINLRLGARYLANQRDYFGGDLYPALAAYNAGRATPPSGTTSPAAIRTCSSRSSALTKLVFTSARLPNS